MKKIKIIYWILTGIFVILSLLTILYVKQDDRPNIALSGAAICISIIAMGLSDPKVNNFNGEVIAWNVSKSKTANPEDGKFHVSMKIINKNKNEPIMDVVYRLRGPSKILSIIRAKNSESKVFLHGYSRIIVDDTFGFLGTTNDENFIPVDLMVKLNEWNSGNIFITVSGSNVHPTTFKINCKDATSLTNSSNSNPIKAKRI